MDGRVRFWKDFGLAVGAAGAVLGLVFVGVAIIDHLGKERGIDDTAAQVQRQRARMLREGLPGSTAREIPSFRRNPVDSPAPWRNRPV